MDILPSNSGPLLISSHKKVQRLEPTMQGYEGLFFVESFGCFLFLTQPMATFKHLGDLIFHR